jgi:hypothetical protein
MASGAARYSMECTDDCDEPDDVRLAGARKPVLSQDEGRMASGWESIAWLLLWLE